MASDIPYVSVQTFFELTEPHQDHACRNGCRKLYTDKVGYVALNTNKDADFVHRNTVTPVKAGDFVEFSGDVFHHINDRNGLVKLAGPFTLDTMEQVGSFAYGTDALCCSVDGSQECSMLPGNPGDCEAVGRACVPIDTNRCNAGPTAPMPTGTGKSAKKSSKSSKIPSTKGSSSKSPKSSKAPKSLKSSKGPKGTSSKFPKSSKSPKSIKTNLGALFKSPKQRRHLQPNFSGTCEIAKGNSALEQGCCWFPDDVPSNVNFVQCDDKNTDINGNPQCDYQFLEVF